MPRSRIDHVPMHEFAFIALLCGLGAHAAHPTMTIAEQANASPVSAVEPLPAIADQVQVRCDGKIVSLAEAVKNTIADRDAMLYHQLRIKAGGTVDDQRQLARWCRKVGFDEEARMHWLLLLSMQRDDSEAVAALHLHNYEGQLLTKEEISELKEQQKKDRAAASEWMPKLKKIQTEIARGSDDERDAAFAELAAINDPRAIPSMLKVFPFSDVAIITRLVEIIAKMPPADSADALIRIAVDAPDEDVREKAAEALREYPERSYVPTLIGGLSAPIDITSHVSVNPGQAKWRWYEGGEFTGRLLPGYFPLVIRRHSQYQESDFSRYWVPETRRIAGWQNVGQTPDKLRYDFELTRESPDPDHPEQRAGVIKGQNHVGTKNKGAKDFEKSVSELKRNVQEANEQSAALNRRIHAALNKATGADVGPSPSAANSKFVDVKPQLWWDWWRKRSRPSDFLADGTRVWTQFGLMPIGKVLVGDRVLARDEKNKELQFTLVVGIENEPQGAVHTIEVAGRTIVTGPGQRFRTPGGDWIGASDLKGGAHVASFCDPQKIDGNGSGDGLARRNLMLTDSPSLFVERVGLEVHDATEQ